MKHVVCNYCGGDSFKVVFRQGQAQRSQIVKCNICGLMYSNPRVGELDEFLVSRSDPEYLVEMLKRSHDTRMDKERLQVRDYVGTRTVLAKLRPQRGNVLEIGSGLGFLLNSFVEDGWHGTGIDPDPLCCEHASKILGLNIITGTLDTAGLFSESYDLVLMMHVIEHVADPMGILKEIGRVIKSDGIVVLETPRYDTFTFRVLRHRERSISCDGHIFFFCTSTLERVVAAAGFTVLKREYVGRSLTADRLLSNIGVITKSQWIQSKLTRISSILHLDNINMRMNLRDMERLYLVKQASSPPYARNDALYRRDGH